MRPIGPRPHHQPKTIIDSCHLSLEAARRILVLTGEADEQSRVIIPADLFPERCEPYFNAYGEQIREAHWTDDEFEAAQAERAAWDDEG